MTEAVITGCDTAPSARGLAARFAALALAGGAVYLLFRLHADPTYGRAGSWVFLIGLLFGWVLQRSRFCFFCMLRDGFEGRDSLAAIAMLLALAVGVTAHTVLFTAWIPNPLAGHLPPRAHIGPVSWVTLLGGFVFGIGMSMSGSCISAHFYRLGEGSLLSPVALLGSLVGAMLGLASWNVLYLRVLSDAPVVWIPAWKGFTLGWALPMLGLGLVGLGLLRWVPAPGPRSTERLKARKIFHAVFTERWPPWVGGLLVGLLSAAALFRSAPLGVTAEINRLARLLGNALAFLPERLEGLDALRGCRIADHPAALTPNALFVLALILGGMIGAAGTGQLGFSRPRLKAYPLALVGGVLLGWGGFVALGCTIGTLLSGVHAGAGSGWVFAVAMVLGVRVSLPLRQWAEK